MMGRTFNKLVRVLAVGGFADTQCGFKLFTRAAAQAVFSRQYVERWAFDVELLFIAQRLKLRVVEVPVRIMEKRPPSINLFKRVPNVLRNLWRLFLVIRLGRPA